MNELNKHYKDTAVKFDLLDIAPDIPFALGNMIKYLIRAGHKEGASYKDDIQKAKVYATVHLHTIQRGTLTEELWCNKHPTRWRLICKLLEKKIHSAEKMSELLLIDYVIGTIV